MHPALSCAGQFSITAVASQDSRADLDVFARIVAAIGAQATMVASAVSTLMLAAVVAVIMCLRITVRA